MPEVIPRSGAHAEASPSRKPDTEAPEPHHTAEAVRHTSCRNAMLQNRDATQLAAAAGRNLRRTTACFHSDRSHCFRRAPPGQPKRTEEKLLRLGDARIQRRSTESPRHRSARVSNTEALETFTQLTAADRPTTEAACLSCSPRGEPRTFAVHAAEATFPTPAAASTHRRSGPLPLPAPCPPKRTQRGATSSRPPKRAGLDAARETRR